MRNLYLLLLLLCFSLNAQQKEKSQDQKAFDAILDYYYDEEFDSALLSCENFMKVHPSSNLLPRVKYNIGYINYEIGKEEEAIPHFQDILNSKYNEYDKAGGLMEEYTLYKHWSSKYLAYIYLDKKEFQKAFKYIKFFDKKYKYKHFCGNEIYANKMNTAYSYAKYYYGIGKSKKSIDQLLPFFFDSGLADNGYVVKYLEELLENFYSMDELKKEFEKSRASFYFDKKGKAFIVLFDEKLKVDTSSLYSLRNSHNYKEYAALGEIDLYKKVIEIHPLFKKYNGS